ncbi:MAG: energy transducer TonB [Fluviicola sp.]|nr:energy transducer TonB [Fluviicola sp.]
MPKSIFLLLFCVLPFAGTSQSARKTNKLLKQEYASKLHKHDSLARLYASSNQELLQLGEVGSEVIRSYSIVLKEVTEAKAKTITLFQKSALLGIDKTLTFTIQSVELLNLPSEREVFEKLSQKYEELDMIRERSFDLSLDNLNVSEQNELLSKTIVEMNGKIGQYSLFNQQLPRFFSLFKEDCVWLKSEEEKWRIETAALELKQHELEQVLQIAKDNFAKNGPKGFDEQYSTVFPEVFPNEKQPKMDWSNLDYEEADGFEEVPMPSPPPPVSDDVVHTYVEESPEFLGGMTALKAFIDANLKIPEVAIEQGLEGKCFLQFIVSKTGNISNVKVLRGVPDCDDCDQEAIRMVKSMPKWKPGKIGGKPVNSVFNLPVAFKLP